jgi:hypothetical protein
MDRLGKGITEIRLHPSNAKECGLKFKSIMELNYQHASKIYSRSTFKVSNIQCGALQDGEPLFLNQKYFHLMQL